MRKKLIPTTLVMWALLGGMAQAAGPFPDVPENYWAADAVRFAAVEHAFMRTGADGNFHGADPFTRLQLGLAMDRLIGELESLSHTTWASPGVGGYTFTDVPEGGGQRDTLLKLANQYHLFEGLPGVTGTTLDANKAVTRYEMAHVLNRLMQLGEMHQVVNPNLLTPHPRSYGDLPTGVWGYDDVRAVSEHYQIMIGFPDNTFRGAEELTRYQFATAARQTFPVVHELVVRTIEATPTPTPEPTPTPTPTPEPLRRWQENTQIKIGADYRVQNPMGFSGDLRWIGYGGPFFGMLRARGPVPLMDNTTLIDGDLNIGVAWPWTSNLALEPFVGGHYAMPGAGQLAGVDYGAVLSWNPSPVGIWIGGGATSPLWANTGSASGLLLWEANAGINWYIMDHLSLSIEGGYGLLPLAPAAGATTFGTDQAPSVGLGLAFGW